MRWPSTTGLTTPTERRILHKGPSPDLLLLDFDRLRFQLRMTQNLSKALEGATPETRAALDEVAGTIDAAGSESYRPLMLLAWAEWCQHVGDEEARRGHLREAWRLFQAMGADGALRRMKRDFGDLVG